MITIYLCDIDRVRTVINVSYNTYVLISQRTSFKN